MFKIGDRVVCVDGTPHTGIELGYRIITPYEGEMYTVRGYYPRGGGIYLEEIVNPHFMFADGIVEPGFKFRRFRLVDNTFGEEVCKNLAKLIEPEYEPA